MARSATIASKRSSKTGLIVGISLVVVTVVIAVIAAKPDSRPAASTGVASAAAATATGTPPAAAPTAVSAVRSVGGLAAREVSFDFGSISMAAGKVSHRYWFRNEGDAPVLVKRVYTSCMCTTATLVQGVRVIGSYGMPGHGPLPEVNQSLVPGEAAYLDVVFDPAAHGPAGLGRTERTVTIENGAGQPLQLSFVAHVTP